MGFNSAFKGLKYIGVFNSVVWLQPHHRIKYTNLCPAWSRCYKNRNSCT